MHTGPSVPQPLALRSWLQPGSSNELFAVYAAIANHYPDEQPLGQHKPGLLISSATFRLRACYACFARWAAQRDLVLLCPHGLHSFERVSKGRSAPGRGLLYAASVPNRGGPHRA